MRENLNTYIRLDNDTKHLENAFNRHFYKLTRGSAPSSVYKDHVYKAFSKYTITNLMCRPKCHQIDQKQMPLSNSAE